MERKFSKLEISGRHFGESLQLTNWILDSGATCHMALEILDFIMCLLVEIDKYIEVADVNFVIKKQTGESQNKNV